MAEKKTDQAKEAAAPGEGSYSREDLIAAAHAFGVTPEVVAGALRLTTKDSLTRSEAEAIIKRFLTREV